MKRSLNISFLVIIFALSLNQLLHLVDKKDTNENRKLAEKPKMNINSLDKFPREYEDYLNDNFAARAYFVDFYGWLNKHFFHKKTLNNKYLLGKDDYIFEMTKDLPLYTGARTVSEEELMRIGKEFQMRQRYFEEKGIKMYIQIVPSKFKIYSNKLPLLLMKGKEHMGDRFVEHIKKNTTIPIIDGSLILLEKRGNENLYLKYDTHWNSLGAFYLHAALIDTIRLTFKELPRLEKDLFNIEPFEDGGGNMKWVAPNKSDFDFGYKITPKNKTFYAAEGFVHPMVKDFRYGQDSYCIRYKSAHTNYPKIVIIRDSFSEFTLSFLPEMFSETLYIWDDWKYKFNKEIIDFEKPDIVVYSFYEGYVDRLLMDPSFVKSNQTDSNVQ